MEAPYQGNRLTIEEIHGLNERQQFANKDLGSLDYLKGAIPTTFNTLTRPGGIQLLQRISPSEQVLNICQTNDSRHNIIVQTDKAIRIISELDFFNQSYVPALTPAGANDDDIMPRALLEHSAAAGTGGGSLTTTMSQMPMTTILSQVNADGTVAAFLTLAANQFTLQAGVYVIKGWHSLAASTAGRIAWGQLYNITAATPAWSGLLNQDTNQVVVQTAQANMRVDFFGVLTPIAPTIYEWRAKQNSGSSTNGMGLPASLAFNEIYGQLEILKTA